MAQTVTIIIIRTNIQYDENMVPTGFMSVDFLINQGASWWIGGLSHVDANLTTVQLQAFLDDQSAALLAQFGSDIPLTPDQKAAYQDIIDIHNASADVANIIADIALITTASPDPNAASGYKAAFTAAAFGALTANQQTVLIRNTISATLTMLLHLQRSVRLLLNIAIRQTH